MSSPPSDHHGSRTVTWARHAPRSDRGEEYRSGTDLVAGDIARLLRDQTPLRDDPAGRAMVRVRTERIAAGSSRRPLAWGRGLVATVPMLVLAAVLWAAIPLPDGAAVRPVPTSAAPNPERDTVADMAPASAATSVVPRQPWSTLSPQDRVRVNAGLPPLARPVTPRAENRLPNPIKAAIVFGHAPAPEALELMRQVQRQRYGG